jgi:hypothetical protein
MHCTARARERERDQEEKEKTNKEKTGDKMAKGAQRRRNKGRQQRIPHPLEERYAATRMKREGIGFTSSRAPIYCGWGRVEGRGGPQNAPHV